MKLDIRGHHLEITPALRTFVEQKLEPIAHHHGDMIDQIQVRLEDVTGPNKGGVDMSCRITAWLKVHVTVNIEELNRDMRAAIELAADRADRAIKKHVERSRFQGHVQHH